MKHGTSALLAVVTLISSLALGTVQAASETTDGKTTSRVEGTLQGDRRQAHVAFDRRDVEVRLERKSEKDPSHVAITFFDRENHSYTMELQASPPGADSPMSTYRGAFSSSFPPVASTMTPLQQSFVGIELRIPLSHGREEKLRLKKYD